MAKVTRTPTPVLHDYHVYNDTLTHLGGIPVVDKDGAKKVRMTRAQAAYFMDQGLIGVQAEDQASDEAQALRRQFRGAST